MGWGTGNAGPDPTAIFSSTPSTITVQFVAALVPSTHDLILLILRINNDFP